MHINRVLMQQHRHGVAIHFTDHNAVLRPCDINNQKIFAGDGAKRQICRRKFLRHPVVPPAGQIQNVLFAEVIKKLARRYALRVAFALFKRKLICRAFDVPQQHIQIIRMYQRVFRRTRKEIFRVIDDVLVKRRGRGDHDRQRRIFAPTRAPRLLPCAGNRPRIAAQHTGVQLADVNAQLQRVGGDYGANLAFAQAALNLPPQRRQIAAPIAPDAPRVAERVFDPFLEVPRQHLNRQPRFAENDGRNIIIHQHGRDVQRLLQNGFADAELFVDHRRVIEDDVLFSARRAALVDHVNRSANQRRGQLPRIGNGRRTADELRI